MKLGSARVEMGCYDSLWIGVHLELDLYTLYLLRARVL